jgi:hypothetical protein
MLPRIEIAHRVNSGAIRPDDDPKVCNVIAYDRDSLKWLKAVRSGDAGWYNLGPLFHHRWGKRGCFRLLNVARPYAFLGDAIKSNGALSLCLSVRKVE